MTNEELQQVVAAVIASLKTNGKTVDQLTAVQTMQDSDYFEISGGRKVSWEVLLDLVTAAITVDLEGVTSDIATMGIQSVSFSVDGSTATLSIKQAGFAAKTASLPVATNSQSGIITATDRAKIYSAYSLAEDASTAASNAATAAGEATAAAEAATQGVNALSSQYADMMASLSDWELCGLYQSYVLGLCVDVEDDDEGGAVTASDGGAAEINYRYYYAPCKSGEKFRVQYSISQPYLRAYCCENEPRVAGVALGERLFLDESFPANTWREVVADKDGWIVFVRPKKANSSNYVIANRKVDKTPLFMLVAMDVDAPVRAGWNAIDINKGSSTYGHDIQYNSGSWTTDFIPVSDADYISVECLYASQARYKNNLLGSVFYGSENEADVVADFNPITLNDTIISGMTTIKVPDGANFVRLTSGSSTVTMRKYRATAEGVTEADVENILSDMSVTVEPKSIFELNPDTEMLPKLSAMKEYRYEKIGNDTNPNRAGFVMAHISDVHGGAAQWARFVEFVNHWKAKGYIDVVIDTGDVVPGYYEDSIDWRAGDENVLTVIGNHDTRATVAEETGLTTLQIWQYHSSLSIASGNRQDAYNKFIAPNVSSWEVVQPTGASANGWCYYYKDFDDYKLRLVFVDIMGYDPTQEAWLEDVLAGARTHITDNVADPYDVAIVAHHCGSSSLCLACNYSSLWEEPQGSDLKMDNYNEDIGGMVDVVAAFQEAGGKFVGYFVGHSHRDRVAKVVGKNQLVFTVSNGGKAITSDDGTIKSRDWRMIEGTKTWDSFQIVGIDTYSKLVKLTKVGADQDFFMRKKGTICVSYDPALISNGTALKGEGW